MSRIIANYAHKITVPYSTRQVVVLSLAIIVVSHWTACAWAGAHFFQREFSTNTYTWVDQLEDGKGGSRMYGQNVHARNQDWLKLKSKWEVKMYKSGGTRKRETSLGSQLPLHFGSQILGAKQNNPKQNPEEKRRNCFTRIMDVTSPVSGGRVPSSPPLLHHDAHHSRVRRRNQNTRVLAHHNNSLIQQFFAVQSPPLLGVPVVEGLQKSIH